MKSRKIWCTRPLQMVPSMTLILKKDISISTVIKLCNMYVFDMTLPPTSLGPSASVHFSRLWLTS
ncbi:hypothetical protein D3C71_1505970 [compost metagenome]